MADNPNDFRPSDSAGHGWSRFGACTMVSVNMYPHNQDHVGIAFAKSVCADCPVRPECLAEAVENGEQWGVWGGLTTDERASLRRRVNRNNLRFQNEGKGELMSLDQLIESTALDEVVIQMEATEEEEDAA